MLAALTSALRATLGDAHVRSGADVQAMDTGWHPDNLGAGWVVLPG